jgi:hypothetical protein
MNNFNKIKKRLVEFLKEPTILKKKNGLIIIYFVNYFKSLFSYLNRFRRPHKFNNDKQAKY